MQYCALKRGSLHPRQSKHGLECSDRDNVILNGKAMRLLAYGRPFLEGRYTMLISANRLFGSSNTNHSTNLAGLPADIIISANAERVPFSQLLDDFPDVRRCTISILDFLLENGADDHVKTKEQKAALHLAASGTLGNLYPESIGFQDGCQRQRPEWPNPNALRLLQ